MKTILVTGSAGFIGANLVKRLFKELKEGTIVGVDNLNDYYDPSLKEYRLQELDKLYNDVIPGLTENVMPGSTGHLSYRFVQGSIADRDLVNKLFETNNFDIVVNFIICHSKPPLNTDYAFIHH